MNLVEAKEIIIKSLKKDKEYKAFYDSNFTVDVDEKEGMIFMLSKESNLSERFKKVIGDGSLQISYNTFNNGSITIRVDFEFGKWFSKIAENVDFAQNYLKYKFQYRIDDHENDYGYLNGFEIRRDNIDGNLEKEIDELFVIFGFVLDV